MHARYKICVLTAFTLLSGSAALAGPNEDAYAVVEQWAAALNAGDLERILGTYTTDATLMGTSSPSLAKEPNDLRTYFGPPLKAKIQVKLGEGAATTISDNAVTWTGFYDFSGNRPDGQPFALQGRYTFVVVKREGNWKIVHHHSSVRPKPTQ
jgi:uncharacterized protein (TIGR02246 family)